MKRLDQCLLSSIAAALLVCAQPMSCFAHETDSVMPQARQAEPTLFDLVAKSNGRRYRIHVHVPTAPAPADGYPLLMVLDGNLGFPIAAAEATIRESSGAASAVVVGVDRATDDAAESAVLRMRDFTTQAPTQGFPSIPGHSPLTADNFGGSAEFLAFLTGQLMPLVAGRYRIDPTRRTLYGHSLGGLFALDVLFRNGSAFDRYVISSPSIWYADRIVLQGEPAFARSVAAQQSGPKVLLSAGSLEESVPEDLPAGADKLAVARILQSARGIANVRELAARLGSLQGRNGYAVTFHLYEDEDHISVIPTSISRALRFATRSR